MAHPARLTTPSYRGVFVVVTSLFFIWGGITVLVGALIPRLRAVFELSYFEAGLRVFGILLAAMFVLPVACYLYIAFYGRDRARSTEPTGSVA